MLQGFFPVLCHVLYCYLFFFSGTPRLGTSISRREGSWQFSRMEVVQQGAERSWSGMRKMQDRGGPGQNRQSSFILFLLRSLQKVQDEQSSACKVLPAPLTKQKCRPRVPLLPGISLHGSPTTCKEVPPSAE